MDIEVDHGFKLFLHQRDFIAGYPIIHCIHLGIEKSRRVIFILSRFLCAFLLCFSLEFSQIFLLWKNFSFTSRNFVKSKWGMEEFTLAHAEAIKHTKTNFIIIILKEKLEMAGLRKDLKMFLTIHNYIDATRKVEQVPERLRFVKLVTKNFVKIPGAKK